MRTASGWICQLEAVFIIRPIEAHGRGRFLWAKEMRNGLEAIVKPFPWGGILDLGSAGITKRVENVIDHLRRLQARLRSPNYNVCIFEIEATQAGGNWLAWTCVMCARYARTIFVWIMIFLTVCVLPEMKKSSPCWK